MIKTCSASRYKDFMLGNVLICVHVSFLCSNRLAMKSTWFIRLMTDVGLEPLLKLIQRFIVIRDKFLTHYSIYKAHLDNRQIWWHFVFLNFEDFFRFAASLSLSFIEWHVRLTRGPFLKRYLINNMEDVVIFLKWKIFLIVSAA